MCVRVRPRAHIYLWVLGRRTSGTGPTRGFFGGAPSETETAAEVPEVEIQQRIFHTPTLQSGNGGATVYYATKEPGMRIHLIAYPTEHTYLLWTKRSQSQGSHKEFFHTPNPSL